MDLEEAIDKLLLEQTENMNVIEALWLLFAAYVQIPTGGTQWVESRRSFFAGAALLFDAIVRIVDPGTEPTEADLRRMDRIARELDRYREDLAKGTA